ncbi:MAG: GNAT family N-acetyltransferase [Candidatus Pacearchaeota archaeon]|nr:GNAT family N-acetyltransferase [Candidatus Pacearchaeota archaeon]
MEIRRFETQDAEETSDLVCEGLRKECSNYKMSEIEKYCRDYSPSGLITLSKEHEMWVSHDKNLITGMTSRSGNIVRMCYVLPGLIRKGIGKNLMSHLESYMKRENYTLALVVAAKNSIHFYESLGYKKYAESKGDILMKKELLQRYIKR